LRSLRNGGRWAGLRSSRLGRRRLVLTFAAAISILDASFIAVLSPLLPHLVDEFGMSKFAAGVVTASYPAGMLVGTVPAGRLAGRIGTQRTAVVGLATIALSSLLFAFAPSGFVLGVARFVQGLGGAAAWAGAMGLVVQSTPSEERAKAITWILQTAFLGMMIGPLLGATADALGRVPIFLGVTAIAGALATWGGPRGLRPTEARGESNAWQLLRSPVGALGLATIIALGAIEGALVVIGPLILSGQGASSFAIAAIFMVAYAAQFGVLRLVERWVERAGPWSTVLGCIAAVAPALMVIPAGLDLPITASAIIVAWCSVMCVWSPAGVAVSQAADVVGTEMGMAMALMNGSWALGLAAGASVLPGIAKLAGDAAGFAAAEAIALLLALAVVRHTRLARPVGTGGADHRRL